MDNDLDSELAPLIISQFIVKLDVMSCQIMYLLFISVIRHCTYGNEKSHNHIIHDVMSLDKHIRILRKNPKSLEFSFHIFNFLQGIGMTVF